MEVIQQCVTLITFAIQNMIKIYQYYYADAIYKHKTLTRHAMYL
jgi:hypothetical protein